MFKPLKAAAICGVLLIVGAIAGLVWYLSVVIARVTGETLVSDFFRFTFQYGALLGLISLPLSICFYYGFVDLGKRFENRLLTISGWTFIILIFIGVLFTSLFYANLDSYSGLYLDELSEGSLDENSKMQDLTPAIAKDIKYNANAMRSVIFIMAKNLGDWVFWPLTIILFLGNLGLRLITGLGLLKLKKLSALSRWAGGFEIASGFIKISSIAMILEILLFWQLSKKLESEQNLATSNEPKVAGKQLQADSKI